MEWEASELIFSGGDTHLYLNHWNQRGCNSAAIPILCQTGDSPQASVLVRDRYEDFEI